MRKKDEKLLQILLSRILVELEKEIVENRGISDDGIIAFLGIPLLLRDKSSKNRFALNRSSFIINKIITSESVTQSIIEELHTCVSNRNSDRQGENRHGIRGGVVRKLPKAFPHEKLIKMVEEEGVGEAIKCYENLRNSNGLADMDDETVEIIKNLFPKPGISRDSLPQCNQDYAIKVTEDDFLSA